MSRRPISRHDFYVAFDYAAGKDMAYGAEWGMPNVPIVQDWNNAPRRVIP